MESTTFSQNTPIKRTTPAICHWSINLVTNEVFLCEGIKKAFGIQADEKIDYFMLLKSINPLHRFIILKLIRACDNQQRFEYDCPIYHEDANNSDWMHITGQLEAKGPELAFEFTGTLMEITDKKRQELFSDDLLAVLSHELKAQLTTIKLYVQLVENMVRNDKNKRAAELMHKADAEVIEMTSVINNILDMSLIFSGRATLQTLRFDMGALINEVISNHFHHINTHRLKIVAESPVSVLADRSKIKRVIYNLLSNAIKYSPEQTDIFLSWKQHIEVVQISVKDKGMGISLANQQKLFKRFSRVESDEVKNKKGYGIGLYIVKEIIRQHGGKVWVESAEGYGSEFSFTLPV